MKNANDSTVMTSAEHRQFIEDLKGRVSSARLSAARAVNRDMIVLYWDIGRGIVEKQKTLGWGESVIDRVSADLLHAFPATTGFSPRNLRNMKLFYLTYSDPQIWLQAVAKLGGGSMDTEIWRQLAAKLTDRKVTEFLGQLVSEIPWGHNLLILNKLTDPAARRYYLRTPDNNPSIGVILCAEKDDVEVEYALRTKQNPIGVAEYQLLSKLSAEMKGKLPTAGQLVDVVRTVLPGKGGSSHE